MSASRERDRVKLDVTLRFASAEAFDEGFAEFLSSGAVFLKTRTPKPVGTRIRLQVRLSTGQLMLDGDGVVLWSYSPTELPPGRSPGIGISFQPRNDASRACIDRIALRHGPGRHGTAPGARLLAHLQKAGRQIDNASAPPRGSGRRAQRSQAATATSRGSGLLGFPPEGSLGPAAKGAPGDLLDDLASAFDAIRSDLYTVPPPLRAVDPSRETDQARQAGPTPAAEVLEVPPVPIPGLAGPAPLDGLITSAEPEPVQHQAVDEPSRPVGVEAAAEVPLPVEGDIPVAAAPASIPRNAPVAAAPVLLYGDDERVESPAPLADVAAEEAPPAELAAADLVAEESPGASDPVAPATTLPPQLPASALIEVSPDENAGEEPITELRPSPLEVEAQDRSPEATVADTLQPQLALAAAPDPADGAVAAPAARVARISLVARGRDEIYRQRELAAQERTGFDGTPTEEHLPPALDQVTAMGVLMDGLREAEVQEYSFAARESGDTFLDEAEAEPRNVFDDQPTTVDPEPQDALLDPSSLEPHGRALRAQLPAGQTVPSLSMVRWVAGGGLERPTPAQPVSWPENGTKLPVYTCPALAGLDMWSKLRALMEGDSSPGDEEISLKLGEVTDTQQILKALDWPLKSVTAERRFLEEASTEGAKLPEPALDELEEAPTNVEALSHEDVEETARVSTGEELASEELEEPPTLAEASGEPDVFSTPWAEEIVSAAFESTGRSAEVVADLMPPRYVAPQIESSRTRVVEREQHRHVAQESAASGDAEATVIDQGFPDAFRQAETDEVESTAPVVKPQAEDTAPLPIPVEVAMAPLSRATETLVHGPPPEPETAPDVSVVTRITAPIGIAMPDGRLRILFERGTRPPFTFRRVLQGAQRKSDLVLEFYQGGATMVSDNTPLGRVSASANIDSKLNRPSFHVEIALGPDGVLDVTVRDAQQQVLVNQLVATMDVTVQGRARVEASVTHAEARPAENKGETPRVLGFLRSKLRALKK